LPAKRRGIGTISQGLSLAYKTRLFLGLESLGWEGWFEFYAKRLRNRFAVETGFGYVIHAFNQPLDLVGRGVAGATSSHQSFFAEL